MINVLYLKDHNKYYFKGEKGAYSSKEKAAAKLMSEYPDRFTAEWEAFKYLDEIKEQSATTSAAIKQQKAEETYLNWQVVYDQLAEKLPVVFAITDAADKIVYTINEQKEVRKISFKTSTELVNALQKDPAVWKTLKSFYATNEQLQLHKHKISFHEFMRKITVEFLMLDEKKQIEPEDIKRISWMPDDYAFKKFDASRVRPGEFPAWQEFLSRLDYPEVFAAWVWSIIEPDNNVRQAMWIVGQGDDGKSVVMKALTNLLGNSYVKSMQARELGEKFFLSSVYGKTLVNYADTEEIYLLSNPKIKQITGADSTSIEFKGKDSFTGDVYAKLFVTSNKNPKINPESRAQVTRLIRLDVKRPTEQTSNFQNRLEAEIWFFLDYCKNCFLKYISEGNNKLNLPVDLQEKIFSLCAADSYNVMVEFFANKIVLGKEHICPVPDFKLALREFATLEQHIDSSQMRHFTADVEDKLHIDGIQAVRMNIDGQMKTVYTGFKLRERSK